MDFGWIWNVCWAIERNISLSWLLTGKCKFVIVSVMLIQYALSMHNCISFNATVVNRNLMPINNYSIWTYLFRKYICVYEMNENDKVWQNIERRESRDRLKYRQNFSFCLVSCFESIFSTLLKRYWITVSEQSISDQYFSWSSSIAFHKLSSCERCRCSRRWSFVCEFGEYSKTCYTCLSQQYALKLCV